MLIRLLEQDAGAALLGFLGLLDPPKQTVDQMLMTDFAASGVWSVWGARVNCQFARLMFLLVKIGRFIANIVDRSCWSSHGAYSRSGCSSRLGDSACNMRILE